MTAACPLDGCTRPVRKRGLCDTCYARLRRRGEPLPQIPDPFWSQVDKGGDCWLWRGSLWYGYGKCGRGRQAHRVAYEQLVGPIPKGMHLDHVCHTRDLTCTGGDQCPHRRCVNPSHLEPVTPAENAARVGQRHLACSYGHPWVDDNIYWYRGTRYCRQCNRDKARAHYYAKVSPGPRVKKTHCVRGHPYDEVNTYVGKTGARTCRTCYREVFAKRTYGKKAA